MNIMKKNNPVYIMWNVCEYFWQIELNLSQAIIPLLFQIFPNV